MNNGQTALLLLMQLSSDREIEEDRDTVRIFFSLLSKISFINGGDDRKQFVLASVREPTKKIITKIKLIIGVPIII